MTDQCLLCQQKIAYHLDLAWFLSWRDLKPRYICKRCLEKFMLLDQEKVCVGCGRPSQTDGLCSDYQYWQNKLTDNELLNNRALYQYQNSAMRAYLERYKFWGDYRLRYVFQTKWCNFIQSYYPLKAGWIYVPIPVDEESFQQRGFNQVVGLAEALPLCDILVMKQRQRRPKQAQKNRQQRLQTPQPFGYKKITKDLTGAKVVLLDDVYTTGRTLYHARAILKKHGAALVRSVTLCR